MTFDIEDWYHANYPGMIIPETGETHSLEESVERILSLCKKYSAKGTFFILTSEAERRPEIVEMILKEGHEIGSHGYLHELIYNMDEENFREELKKSIEILKNITGKTSECFRAPSWSVGTDLIWYFRCLKEAGIKYDSSIFPVKTFLFGDPSSPPHPFEIEGVKEIPASVISFFGKRIPFGGGFSFRFMPFSITASFIKLLNRKGIPALFYLHPREIDPEHPRLDLPLKEKFIHYYNLKSTFKKLEELLQKFHFTSIGDYFGD
ncbi:MAG: polysaccharide deacetylase family protein [Candidatus Aminicenantia bacterium]